MSSISGYGNSRVYNGQVLRAQSRHRDDRDHNDKVKSDREGKAIDVKAASAKSEVVSVEDAKVKGTKEKESKEQEVREVTQVNKELLAIEVRLAGVEEGLADSKQTANATTRAIAANGTKLEALAKDFSNAGDALKRVAASVVHIDAKSDGNGKRIDELSSKFSDLSEKLVSALGSDGKKAEIEILTKHTKEVATRVDQALGKSEENGRKIDALGTKFDSLAENTDKQLARLTKQFDDAAGAVGKRLDVTDARAAARFKEVEAKIDKVHIDLNDRLGKLDDKVDDLSTKQDHNSRQTNAHIDEVERHTNDRFDRTDRKIDDLETNNNDRFDDVDNKLTDISTQLGEQANNAAQDLSKVVTELKVVIKQGDTGNAAKLTDAVKGLKDDFNKQFNDLKTQHEAETNALLEKLNEVTEQLKTLSEQSAEQITVLKDQLGGLGGQLGTVINKLDLLGSGQSLSLRSIGLFNVAAKVGDGALDKLIGVIGQNGTGNQLRNVQARLQSVSGRFGSGQSASGLNLLA